MAFVFLFAFAFLSSEVTQLFGLEQLRMLGFGLALAALLFCALLRTPQLAARAPTVPLVLALLLAAILAFDPMLGEVDPLDYRIALLLPIFVLAPNIARLATSVRLRERAWWWLATYLVASAAVAFVALPEGFVRGREDLIRLDFSGSLVAHAGLCTIFAVWTVARLACVPSTFMRAVHFALVLLASAMVFATGTRTALATLALIGLFAIGSSQQRARELSRLLIVAGGFLALFSAYSLFVSDDFAERLVSGSGEDWSSGRFASQLFWLARALEQPFGLGFGAVREWLRDGRPALDGSHHLEWPHNEFLRFFVEAGVLGLAFIVLLIGWLVRRALLAARVESDLERRALLLAITADMVAQCLFQNYFNNIYYATALVTLLVVLIEQTEARHALERATAGEPAPLSKLPAAP